MLAIARALLFNPKLLVMDEPTEGLAPIIVQQVEAMLKALAAEGEISVLLIEQNLGVAIDVADTVDVMVNGRIARSMSAAELAADRELQQRLLGVRTDVDEGPDTAVEEPPDSTVQVLTVKRAADSVVVEPAAPPEERTIRGVTRWGSTGRDHVVAGEPAGQRRRRRSPASWSSRWPRPSDARRTSPAPSTPRGASSSSCVAASRSWGCGR